MKRIEKIVTVSFMMIISLLSAGHMAYAIDVHGHESSQYIISYETGAREFISCESYDELISLLKNAVTAKCQVWDEPDGATIEWTIDNAMLYDYVYHYSGDFLYPGFYWCAAPGMSPSSYIVTDEHERIDTSALMIPASEDYFILLNGYTIKDVSIELLEIETLEIGTAKLIPWMANKFDSPQLSIAHSSEYDDMPDCQYSDDDVYLPESHFCLLDKFNTPNPMVFNLTVYLGQYNPYNWNLKAVKRIKYRVHNAKYLHSNYSTAPTVITDQQEIKTFFTIDGMEIAQPDKKGVYIEMQNGVMRKVMLP